MAVAEQVFEASSCAVMARMSAVDSWSASMAMGAAIQLHIGMVTGFGMVIQEVAELCDHIAAAYHQDNEAIIRRLEKNLNEQNAQTLPMIRALWDQCEIDSYNNDWFGDWRKAIGILNEKLHALYDNGQLEVPYRTAHKSNQLWSIYESYIHMTNNRLGITRDNEVLIAYILGRALKDYDKSFS
jgi:thiopeptide-type bacteriocin biosynthesis protein